jgi:hypothetical protein
LALLRNQKKTLPGQKQISSPEMRSNDENIAKETSNKLSGNRKSFGHLCRKALMHPPVPKNSHGKIPEPHFNYRNNPRKPSGKKTPLPY